MERLRMKLPNNNQSQNHVSQRGIVSVDGSGVKAHAANEQVTSDDAGLVQLRDGNDTALRDDDGDEFSGVVHRKISRQSASAVARVVLRRARQTGSRTARGQGGGKFCGIAWVGAEW